MTLRVRDAARRFGSRPVFDGLDLDVPAGTRLLLDGRNGAGKTTLLRCLAGTLTFTAGEASVAGHPAGSAQARRLTGVCLTPEQGLYGRLSGHDNLLLAARLRLAGPAARTAVARLETELEIEPFARVPTERCSAGMRARVTIARALLGDPALLLLDEPGRSLDVHARALLWAALDRRRDLTCVLVSHHPEDRDRCDRALSFPVHGER
ncbi:ABC transporter ATP-binding protein [Micromonospora mirobrigensis]|uniref:ABC-2 type transport system ATP-binding protein n=1 Tax=Micromonospora mirobrigensis TaxID=262898 RepID=A0A1C4Z4N5_9ACTN|nr:ATP-binding cassette domain-containing protein [Micromonospora mirobrigensis]SCF27979.1 ABC-2 type transport system ATP-binding protein [Micromonospora mirobrigensis]